MSEQIRISAKNLGELALPGFCPRCFWIKSKVNNKLPFQIFPGIFSTIDSYTKNIVHNWFDTKICVPSWLQEIGDVTGYKKTPHHSKFFIIDEDTNILLSGTPDDIFVLADNSHAIIDYKTARYTGTQDSLFPLYKVQLNAYALIGKDNGFDPVSTLSLVYMEPQTLQDIECENSHHRENGFNMVFAARVLNVPHNEAIIKPLLRKAREIFDSRTIPEKTPDCQDCLKLEGLIDLCAH
jgi:hypothetical protein